MKHTDGAAVVFDLGGVLIDWNPRYLYRKIFGADEAAMERFLSEVCTPVWNARLDAGRPFAEGVTELMRAKGIALVPLSDAFESHQMAMPNKIFHAVHAGVPVVATEVAELAAVVREHDLGELYRSGDPASLAAAVERVRARYPDLLRSVAAAAGPMSWDADAEVLRGVYDRLSDRR